MFITSMMSFCISHKHLLLTLLTLEFLSLYVFYLMYIYTWMVGGVYYLMVFYMIFTVCEACLGLSILVSMIRSHGNDKLSSLFMTW
nr:NADH dehydrogenase subunit 4L [Myrmedobia distinguenda]